MCFSVESGASTIFRVLPSLPFCPPGLRPDFSRKLFLLGRFSSFDGGTELLLLFLGVSYLAKRFFRYLTSASSSCTLLNKNWTNSFIDCSFAILQRTVIKLTQPKN